MTIELLTEISFGVSGSPFLNYSNTTVQVFTFTFEKGFSGHNQRSKTSLE
jgi:hypothetical protein